MAASKMNFHGANHLRSRRRAITAQKMNVTKAAREPSCIPPSRKMN